MPEGLFYIRLHSYRAKTEQISPHCVLFARAALLEGDCSMTTVQVERPEDTKLADWFAELRLWFDNNDCAPILFTDVGGCFNIRFADDAQARLFATSFSKYGPSIRRPIAELTEIDKDPT
jgi:hypothetical protein